MGAWVFYKYKKIMNIKFTQRNPYLGGYQEVSAMVHGSNECIEIRVGEIGKTEHEYDTISIPIESVETYIAVIKAVVVNHKKEK